MRNSGDLECGRNHGLGNGWVEVGRGIDGKQVRKHASGVRGGHGGSGDAVAIFRARIPSGENIQAFK